MGLEKIAEKLDKYYERMEQGTAATIKPAHVDKVIAKLQAKKALLLDELREAEKPAKKSRLESKLVTIGEQIERAEWLLKKIGS